MTVEDRRALLRRRLRLGVALGALLLGLVGAEVALRVAWPQPDPNAGLLEPVVHDRFVLSAHAPQVTTFAPDPAVIAGLSPRVTFTINQFGFRSPRLTTLDKPAGATRVFVVGASTAECLYLDDAEAWPERVQAALVASRPGLDVINAGHSGDSTREHMALLAHRIVAFAPDVVVFLVGGNDAVLYLLPDYAPLGADARSKVRHSRFSPTQGFLAKLTRASHLARGVTWLGRERPTEADGNPLQDGYGAWIAAARARRAAQPERSLKVGAFPPPEYERNLRSLIALTRAHNARPVLLTQPALWGAPAGEWERTLWISPRPDHRLPHTQLWTLLERTNDVTRKLAQQEAVTLIDLARTLPKEPRYFYDDLHFTVAGSAAVAEIVAKGLQAELH